MEPRKLECWVFGGDTDTTYNVEISDSSMTVTDLKATIRNASINTFRDVDAAQLVLYSIRKPPDDPDDPEAFEKELAKWTPNGQNRLNGRQKLTDLFKKFDEWLIIATPPYSSSSHAPQPNIVAPDLTLNCWVRGQDISCGFEVQVSSTKSVSALRKVIKGKKPVDFHDIDADGLVLYKFTPSVPNVDDERLKNELKQWSPRGEKELNPRVKLSSLISEADSRESNDQLHLIIDAFLSIRCWLRGADPESFFQVRLQTNSNLGDLKNAIKTAQPGFSNLAADRLRIYKVPAGDEVLREVLGSLGSGQALLQMGGHERLGKIFDDICLAQMPRVVVEALEQNRHTGDDDPIATARNAFLASATPAAPSNTAVPSTFRRRQTEKERSKAIPCGRPNSYEGDLPVTLLHSVFGQFVDDCQTIEVTIEDITFARRLADVMSELHESEWKRVTEVDKVFQDHGIHFNISKTTGYVVDADLNINGHRYVIAEFKNETGNTSAEPYFQAIGYYLEGTRETAVKFTRSPLPCLLLAIFGPCIVFAGAVWNLRPTVQILSTPIAFHFHTTDILNHLTVTRHMAAFRKATKTLRQYYETLTTTVAEPVPRQIFPYRMSYTSLQGDRTEKEFHYLSAFDSGKRIFCGVEGETDHICIKFVQRYSRAAHEFLAGLNHAPTLRGFEELHGGWYMVVMDMLPEDFESLYERSDYLSPEVFDDISATLKSFHEAGFVHGDVRDTNIMVSKTDEMQYKIIDFDWAGEVQKTRYPAYVNREQIVRPEDAVEGNEILVAHDMFMLEQIAQRKTRPRN